MSESHPIPPASGEQDATLIQVQAYNVGSWRDGPVGSGVAVSAVMIGFHLRAADVAMFLLEEHRELADDVAFGIRIKSRGELNRLISMLNRHADDVWGEPQ